MVFDQTDVLLKVVSVLENMSIPYLVGGSYASSTHGMARATMDIDLLVAIKPEHARSFAAELQAEFYADERTIEHAVRTKRHFNVIHLDTTFKIDVFVAKGSGFEASQFERRQLGIVKGDAPEKVYVATAEDTVLAKLEWYRRGNEVSDQQWRDIKGVIKVQGDRLDMEYLNRWARELGVSDLLERALTERS